MTSSNISARSVFRCFQSLLTFIFVSICLFLLSVLTFFTLRKHLLPISHLDIPIPLGLPPSFNPKNDAQNFPSYLVSTIDLSDPMYEKSPLDISYHSYRIELHCQSPRSYQNRQLGSFFVQIILSSTSKQLIIEQSRLILFPYQSEIVYWIRTMIFLPLSILGIDYDRWNLKEILIERSNYQEKSKNLLEVIQLNVIPSSFQLDQCSLHFHILDLTGIVYFYMYYPIITGCLSIFVLFSIYMTFYLIITTITMLNQTSKVKKDE